MQRQEQHWGRTTHSTGINELQENRKKFQRTSTYSIQTRNRIHLGECTGVTTGKLKKGTKEAKSIYNIMFCEENAWTERKSNETVLKER